MAVYADVIRLRQCGRRAEAESLCRKRIAENPQDAETLWLLGEICYEKRQLNEALTQFGRAVEAAETGGKAVPLEWRLTLGALHQQKGSVEPALECFLAATAEYPESADAHFCLATIRQACGTAEDAIASYHRTLRLAPRHILAMNNLGILLRDAGKPAAAEKAFRTALRIDPRYADALQNYGSLLQRMGRFTEAQRILQAAERENLRESGLQRMLAQNEVFLGELSAAKARLANLVRRTGEDTGPLTQLASIHLFEGNSAEATRLCLAALERYRSCAAAHYYLAAVQYELNSRSRMRDIRRALKSPGMTQNERALLLFAGADRLDAASHYAEASSWYRRANALRHRMLSAQGAGYDRKRHDARVDRLLSRFGPDSFVPAKTGMPFDRPVFIVGMPRSGTSLIEQILASHPKIAGAGELPLVGEEVARLSQRIGFPERMPDRTMLSHFAASYESRLLRVDPRARYVTDKQPTNFLNLGFIALAFPDAHVIHCRRDQRDTILSCYFQNFVGTGMPFSYDMQDLAHYYRAYLRIMEHWRKVLPLPILEIDYEDLVSDQENQTRRLLDFLEADWNDACLEFHRTNRPVATASHTQVRRPIYRTSVGRWRNYIELLELVS